MSLRHIIIAFSLILAGSIGSATLFSASTASAACADDNKILTLKPWYSGLMKDGDCENLKDVTTKVDNPGTQITLTSFILKVILNIVDDLFQLVGYVTTGFIIYGGFIMLTANGSPEKVTRARQTILNAVIGLVVAMAAIALVNMVNSTIK